MKSLTRNKVLLILSLVTIKNLVILSCIWGCILYFTLWMLKYDISYLRCCLTILLIKSLSDGINSYFNKNKIEQAIQESIEEYNKKL